MPHRPARILPALLGLVASTLAVAARPAAAACSNPGGACAIDFGGTNSYVTFGNTPALGLPQFTLELWFNRQGTGTTATTGTGGVTAVPLITKGRGEADGSNVDMNYFLGIRTTDNLLVADFEEGAAGAQPGLNHPIAGTTPIATGVWYHAAVTYDGATWHLYLNGIVQTTLAVNQPPQADSIQHAALATALTSTGAAAGFFDGVIDEARIWSYARSAAEIQGALNQEVYSAPGLVARWGLNEGTGGTGTIVADSAAPPQNGTVIGANFQWTDGGPVSANLPPATPGLNAPADGATNVSTAPVLDVAVSDPELSPLDVTFWGREVIAPGPDFTVVILPDTQYYSCGVPCSSSPAVFQSQTQWIVDNRLARNIAYVGHLGDCVEHGNLGNGVDPNPDYEWNNASAAMSLIEDPVATQLADGMPFGILPGNHDQTPNGDPVGTPPENSTAKFNQFFGVSRYSGRAYYGGHFGTNNDNNYTLFSASGLDFVVVDLEYAPTPDPAVLAWADGVLQAHPTRRAIVLTHHMLGTGNPGAFSAQGQAIYDTLKHNPNLFLLLGGHVPGEGRRQDVFDGRVVNSLLSDYQGRTNGGNGWLRVMTFSPANGTIQVQTYSPWLNQFETDADSQFTLTYDMATTGFAPIATVPGVASGTNAQATWASLFPGMSYEWYVTVSDGANTSTGPVWRFATGLCGPDGASCNDGLFCNGADSCSGGMCSVHAGDPCGGGPECAETCDEVRDDCFEAAGTPCTDDGNACTNDVCSGAGACVHPETTAACSDGNACTTGDVCSGGACIGGPPANCDDANPCTDDTCDPATGCLNTPNTAACSDGSACTVGDTCAGGSCVGGPPLDCNDTNPCTDDGCNPATGCTNIPNNAACDDGNACTTVDVCSAGACQGSIPPNCNDGNLCTDDTCNPASGCAHTFNTTSCDDGDACTIDDACGAGTCHGGTAANCDDANACTADSCVPASGCVHAPLPNCCMTNAQCADSDQCTTNERCVGNTCVTDPVGCNDANPCTSDGCNPASGCTHTPNNLPCNDGNACTTADACSGGACVGGPPPNCNDLNVCTNDACSPTSGCTHTPNTAPCTDGIFCNGLDTCAGGTCSVHGGNPCPGPDGDGDCAESCNEATDRCTAPDPNGSPCNDGLYCTVGEVCNAGVCTGTPRDCSSSGDQCRTGTCNETADACDGPPKPDGTPCDDGNACSNGESCVAGVCSGGAQTICPACETCIAPGGCQTGARPDCRTPIAPLRGKLVVFDRMPDAGDGIAWKWSKGAATAFGDLGDPVTSTDYTLCIFDHGGSHLAVKATAPAGRMCGSVPCWRRLGSFGFKYTDKGRLPEGVLKVLIRSGGSGSAKAQLKAKGDAIPPFALPLVTPVVAQLQATGAACWQTDHVGPPALQRNDGMQFKAKDE